MTPDTILLDYIALPGVGERPAFDPLDPRAKLTDSIKQAAWDRGLHFYRLGREDERKAQGLVKYCSYCKNDTHNDSECWSTRPDNWKASDGPVPVFAGPTKRKGMSDE